MYIVPPGTTQNTIYLKIRNSSTGLAQTGLTATSAGAQCSYTRALGSATAISLSSLSGVTAAWSAGGFIEVDPTKAPGLYRLDLPDAAIAAGVPFTIVALTFTNTVQEAEVLLLQQPQQPAGAGAIQTTVTITNSQTSQPIAGAAVWVTTDSGGTNVVAGSLNTNAQGVVTFFLNHGTYCVWCADPGFSANNPTAITV
jgi:hypothetical protein